MWRCVMGGGEGGKCVEVGGMWRWEVWRCVMGEGVWCVEV